MNKNRWEEGKHLHIPPEFVNTKYDGTDSCHLMAVDFESLPSRCTIYIEDPDAPRVNDTGDL